MSAEFTGTTRAIESAEVRARVSGILTKMHFTPSSMVEEGDILFTIERDAYQAARDASVARLKSAKAELARAESDLSRIEIAIQNNAVSRQDLDLAQAKRDQADAAVLGAQADLDNAELNLSYTLVRTPISGQVGRNLVDIGNLVGQGEPTLLTTVNKMDPIFVYFDAPERLVLQFAEARRGADPGETTEEMEEHPAIRVVVKLANENSFLHPGHIDYIANTVDPATGTIQLRAVLENPDLVLFPGLFVRIRVMAGTSRPALLISERAVSTDIGGKYVLLVGEGNIVEQRYVELGQLQDDGTIVVESGLEGNEQYIVNGILRARPGFPVTPMTEEQARARAQDSEGAGN
jgi:RND family efflux transporter MFP subunit